jgi:hypothetical protein
MRKKKSEPGKKQGNFLLSSPKMEEAFASGRAIMEGIDNGTIS